MPEVKSDASGQRKKTFITGCSVQEAPKNDVDTSKPKDDEAGSSTGGNDGGNGDGGDENGGGYLDKD
jgi:hypothetical protein